jgi:lipopolysaccharide transport system permease protein
MTSATHRTLPRRLVYARDLVREMVVRDLKLRYKRSYLGLAWTLVNPLSQLIVYYFVFRVLFGVDTPNYIAFLFIGITSWNWFSGALLQSTNAILDNRDLVRQPGFPSAILPGATVAAHLVHFLLTLPVLFGLLVASDIPLTAAAMWLPVLVLIQFELTLALAFLLACLHVSFRDTQHLLGILLMLGFFMTPILYERSVVPERYLVIYHINLMTSVIEAYRRALLHGETPDLRSLAIVAGASALMLAVFYKLFMRASIDFAEEI